jgi:adenosine deaminase
MEDVVQTMTFAQGESHDFHRFLGKFAILDKIKWTEELIDDSIRAVCEDLIYSGTDYTWMRFSINKYMNYLNWHRKDAILFVKQAFDKYAPGRVGLVLSIKYESQRANQRQISSLVEDPDIADAVEGIDLVGDETFYDPMFYAPLFRQWSSAGKRLFAHVGESQSARNIMTAMSELGVRDVCHGIRAVSYVEDDPCVDNEITACARDNDVCFHLALSSNILTGVLDRPSVHPVSTMLASGIKVTIGTDDPVQCNTDLRREYDLLRSYLMADGTLLPDVEPLVRLVKRTAAERVKGNIIVDRLNR